MKSLSSFKGCLLGGAVGDALGSPVEFLNYEQIQQKYGEKGIIDLEINQNGKAEITDDTQMVMFTAEGLIRAHTAYYKYGVYDVLISVYDSYLRWLYTQGIKPRGKKIMLNGWLINLKGLHNKRGPGNTCISALSSGEIGTKNNPLNKSKGCGGVMRAAPVGLIFEEKKAFQAACDIAAITHGHPSGYLSAGALACIISSIVKGQELDDSIKSAMELLKEHHGNEECLQLLEKAFKMAREGKPSVEKLRLIGEGWVGEEALAAAVYCSLVYKNDFYNALCLAVNHAGDSDSTGAITGNILGTLLGLQQIPARWANNIEFKEELLTLAEDLFYGCDNTKEWFIKYPI